MYARLYNLKMWYVFHDYVKYFDIIIKIYHTVKVWLIDERVIAQIYITLILKFMKHILQMFITNAYSIFFNNYIMYIIFMYN